MKRSLFAKKFLATILAVTMLFTTFVIGDVFNKSSADASTGQYYVLFVVTVSDEASLNNIYLNVTYKTNNGTGSEDASGNVNGSTGTIKDTYTIGTWVSGFPTAISWHINASLINHKFVYSAKAYVASSSISSASDGSEIAYINSTTDSSGSSNKEYTTSCTMESGKGPVATTINTGYSPTSLTLGTSNVTSSVQSQSATDQYGVTMITTPTYSRSCSVSTTGVSINSSSGLLTATSAARLSGSGVNSQTATCTVSWPGGGGAGTKSTAITLTDPKYTATFYNASGSAMSTQSIYYGDTATAPSSPSKNYDSTYHYAFSSWSPAATTAITAATSFTPQYTSTAHSYTNTVTTAATCTSTGVTTHTCSCGYSYTTSEPAALGHNYTSAVTTAATCTAKGVRTYTCTRCGASYTEEIAALGHNYTTAVTAPTCTAQGYTTHTCTRGDSTYVDTYVAALGHTYTSVVTAPTCTAKGYTTHTCSVCGDSYVDNNVAALGHDYTKQVKSTATLRSAATCTADATYYYTCTRCGTIDKTSTHYFTDTGTMLAHTWNSGAVTTAATCTTKGVKTYTCSVCGATKTEDIAALGHDYTKQVKSTATLRSAATCTADATYYYTCSRCSEIDKTSTHYFTDTGSALGHNFVSEVKSTATLRSAATCTADATYYYTCTRDGVIDKTTTHYFTDTGSKLAHTYTSKITTQPTCTVKGVRTYTCSVCGATYTEEVAALGHDYVSSVTAPTCTEKGYTTHTCSRGDSTYTDTYVDALGHDYTSEVKSTATLRSAATCTADATYYYTCSRDGVIDKTATHYFTDTGSALGHDYSTVVTAPTCTAKGYTTHTCSRGDSTYVDTYVDALGHDYTSQVKSSDTLRSAATCTADATYYYTCSRDGVIDKTDSHYFTDTGTALGHDYTSEVKSTATLRTAATCTADATYYYTCSRDGVIDKTATHYFTDTGSALGHDYTSEVKSTATLRSAATCTADATYYYTCSRDGVIDKTATHYFTDTGTALGHSYDDGVITTAATCTAKGVKTYTCNVCGNTYTEEIAALGHNYVSSVTAPTCTVQGYTTHTCSRCSDSYVDTITAPLGHEYGEWTQTTNPTCTETGLQTRSCIRGDNVETQEVAALGHDKQIQQVMPEDHTAGCIYYKCSRCNTYWAATTVVDKGTGEKEVVPAETSSTSLSDVKEVTDPVPAPTFNSYSDESIDYDYSNRGAGLKLDDITYTDTNTIQNTRFAGSMLIPSGVDYTFASTSNSVTDFGFVYSQSDLIDYDITNLEYGKSKVYKMSVAAQNSGTFDGTNWSGVSVHNVSGSTILTFNLLIGIKAKNWSKEYCARAYITYNYQGFSYTVYDWDYSSRSVQAIAEAVVGNTSETAFARNYCQTKIIDHLS